MKDLKISSNDYVYCDSADPRSINELKLAGFNAIGAIKDVAAGIEYVKRFNLLVVESSINFIKEIKDYKWKERNGMMLQEPVRFRDHILDAMRYALHTFGSKYLIDVSTQLSMFGSVSHKVKNNNHYSVY